MDDRPEGYDYPDIVEYSVLEGDIRDYREAAKYIKKTGADVLSVQHEFGIFGGAAGSHVLELLKNVDIPIVTTFHTVLRNPDEGQIRVVKQIDQLSSRLIVMSERGRDFLIEVYGVDTKRIDVIHHGIHALPRWNGHPNGRRYVLTFGLLGPDKGIENVIAALPEVVKKHDIEYVVVGATHPNLVAQHGEVYRDSLVQMAKDMCISDRVRFVDRFVSREELATYMSNATIYVTPYNKLQQITSGTLAYAVGNGKAVISTPYWYAEELLADGRGLLVPPKDPDAMARAIGRLLSDESERQAISGRALAYGEQMLWPNVAKAYQLAFGESLKGPLPAKSRVTLSVPDPDFRHLRMLTDDTGILQHATYAIPNRKEGYCLDDNARALQLVCMAYSAGLMSYEESVELSRRYLAFASHAFNPETGAFRNFMSYDRRWLESVGSDDSQGRTMRALGIAATRGPDRSTRVLSGVLFDRALPYAMKLRSPRAVAFIILGVLERLADKESGLVTVSHLSQLAGCLGESLQRNSHPDWQWFEDSVTYCNAVLPQALLAAGEYLGDAEMKSAALDALVWLSDVQSDDDHRFLPIGSNGFKVRGGKRAHFDQQPVEAWASVSAYANAYRITGDSNWLTLTRGALGWFLGESYFGLPIYDAQTGGCKDGLHHDRLNENQGAESTLSYLLSLCEWQQITKIEIPLARSIVQMV